MDGADRQHPTEITHRTRGRACEPPRAPGGTARCALLLCVAAVTACGEGAAPAPVIAPAHPASLSQAILRARQDLADASYALDGQGDTFTGRSPDAATTVRIDAGGATLTSDRSSARLALARWGCAGDERAVAPTAPERERSHRVRFARGPLTEWMHHGPAGLEQGFDVTSLPGECAELRFVARESEGLEPRVAPDRVELTDAQGVARWAIDHAWAEDATGRELPLRFEREGRTWALRVDVAGAALPIHVDPTIFRIEQLLSAEGAGGYQLAVAIEGDRAVIGDYYARVDGLDGAGAVYVFTRAGTTWTLEQRIVPTDRAALDWFGWEVDLDGDTIVVGSLKDDTVRGTDSGSARVFRWNGATWAQEALLVSASFEMGFGCGVAVDGDVIVAGPYGGPDRPTAGSATIFERTGTTWTAVQRVTPSGGGAFGREVDADGGTIVVAAMMESGGLAQSGALYVYVRGPSGWVQQARLTTATPRDREWLGYAVQLRGDRLVASAAGEWSSTSYDERLIVFERSGTAWSQVLSMPLDIGMYGSQFDVATHGDWIVAGRYVLSRASGSWSVFQSFGPRIGGAAVGIWGDTVILSDGSQVFAYRLGEPSPIGAPCRADTECASGACVSDVCCESTCGRSDGRACMACTSARTGSPDGLCRPLLPVVASTVVCRDAVGVCDAEESCSPLSTECPPDVAGPAGRVCRGAAGPCDLVEACDGIDPRCPSVDARVLAGVTCRPAAGGCDVEETCDGVGATCPADVRVSFGAVCRPPAGECDVEETCTGAAACPPDLVLGAGHTCRAGGDPLCDVRERCDGLGPLCPPDAFVPDGTSCSDGLACDGHETCVAGSCTEAPTLECDDRDPCTADACSDATGCEHAPIAGCCHDDADCDDAVACTDDRCPAPGGTCTHENVCLDAGAGDGGAGDGDAGDGDAGDADVLDADVGLDGSTAIDGGDDPLRDAGCGCRVPGHGGRGDRAGGALGLAALVLATLLRRRRTRVRTPGGRA